MTLAVKAASPRAKVFINVQTGDARGGLMEQALTTPMTPGGSDTWGAIVDGVCIAPYLGWTDGYNAALAKADGAERIANIGDQAESMLLTVPAKLAAAKAGIRGIFDRLGRTDEPALIQCYEQGLDFSYQDNAQAANHPTPGFIADISAYVLSDRCRNQLERLHAACFNGGATVVCTYQFGPSKLPMGQYFAFGHAQAVDDTTSAEIAADIAIGDLCAAGINRIPAIAAY